MNNPLVSVMISAHIHDYFAEKAVDVVLSQAYQPIELLAVGGNFDISIFEDIKRPRPY
jgi:hypothetical protein